jgi:hypothetical protein
MSKLQTALDEYLAVHRALGFKLRLPGRLLQRFVDFADRQGAAYITRAAKTAARPWAKTPFGCCAAGCASVRASPVSRLFRPRGELR